jgi:hypothetical protein
MIVVKVELHSAATGKITLLNSVVIANISGGGPRRTYHARSFRKGHDPVEKGLHKGKVRSADVKDHPAERDSVLCLVRKALSQMGY